MEKINEMASVDIPIGEIRESKTNVHARERRNDATYKGLRASIEKSGMIHRIAVRKDTDGGYTVVDGHRRLAVLRELKVGVVPCTLLAKDEGDAFAAMVAANIQRMDNDPVLEAEAIEAMFAAGKTREEIAAKIGKDAGYVSRRARLIKLEKPWRDFARRVPCTTDMLERVAAHDGALQRRVAEESGLDEYEAEGDVCGWGEFASAFKQALRDIGEAIFDTSDCAMCESNTGCHAYLFDFLGDQDGDKGKCQNELCYRRRHEAVIDDRLARLRKAGTPAIEVADRWRVPEYWNSCENRNKKHPQAYVYMSGGLRHIAFSVPPAKPERAEVTQEEREAAREARRRVKVLKEARRKLREAYSSGDTELTLGDAFAEVAQRYTRRVVQSTWLDDFICNDIFEVLAMRGEISSILGQEECEIWSAELNERADGNE